MEDIINITQARKDIYKLINQVNESHEPVQIKGKINSAVLISQSSWDSIKETLYIESIPRLSDSIIEGMKEPLNKCAKELDW